MQQAELQDLRLLACTCKPGVITQRPSELKQSITIQVMENPDPRVLPIRAIFTIVGTESDGQETLSVEAHYGLMYRIESLENFAPDDKVHFGQLIGLNNAWPYWREFVQSLTARMGFPPLTLPLIRPAQLLPVTPASIEKENGDTIKKRARKKRQDT
jgi:preprotein translocase subunit SecB